MLLSEIKAKKAKKDNSPLGQLKELPQPIGVNGGSYTYWVDVTKTPLKWVASDGSEIDKATTLEGIKPWLSKHNAEFWQEFLDGVESLDFMLDERVIRLKKGRTDQADHETRELTGEGMFEAYDAEADKAFAMKFLGTHGISDPDSVKSIMNMASWHHAEADRIGKMIKNQVITAGNGKLVSGSEMNKIIAGLRKGIADDRSDRPVAAGTRHIEAVKDDARVGQMKDFVSMHNKANKTDKLKLSVYDRKDGKKIWLDGGKDAIGKFKKAMKSA